MAEMLCWKKFPVLREFLGLQKLSYSAPGHSHFQMARAVRQKGNKTSSRLVVKIVTRVVQNPASSLCLQAAPTVDFVSSAGHGAIWLSARIQ